MKEATKNGSFQAELETCQNDQNMAKLTISDAVLNPKRTYLSNTARLRLWWVYVLEYECRKNITYASRKIGISREWLTKLYAKFQQQNRDPRSLEPGSRAPLDCSKRNRVPEDTENPIVRIRKKYPAWGKEKIVCILKRDHGVVISSSTVGRYLRKHKLPNVKLAEKNRRAARRSALLKKGLPLCERPPQGLADAAPGSLIAKDMKLIAKTSQNTSVAPSLKDKRGTYFWYQHTTIDSCSRFRVLSFVESSDARTARRAFEEAFERLPFPMAALLSDNGGENAGEFHAKFAGMDTPHFRSRPGTSTDNP